MNLVKKFTVAVATSRVSVEVIEPEILNFTDGSLRVALPQIEHIKTIDSRHGVTISAFIESMDDLMVVAQIKEITMRKLKDIPVHLNILGTPYTRYDRVMLDNGTDGFGLKCFAEMVNALNLAEVRIFDPHSEMTTRLIKNCVAILQSTLASITIGAEGISQFDLVCPDNGAKAKMDHNDIAILCTKTRNVATGRIEGVKVAYDSSSGEKPLLVMDDICEGGRTFLGVADAIKGDNETPFELDIRLYITHGIFSNDAISKLLTKYSHIYVYMMKETVYNALTETQKQCVTVANLIQA